MSDATLQALIITGIVAIILLSIAIIYWIIFTRKLSKTVEKVDYLVEDVTYKSESLSVAVEAINKTATQMLSFDAFAKKSMKSIFKLVSENKDGLTEYIENIRKNAKKRQQDDLKKSETKKAPAKKKTTKKAK